MSDIFISYARSTAREAEAMGETLRSLGYSVWRDNDLPSHRSYSDVIEEQIGLARAVLVVWSTEAVRSQWVRSEADKARGRDKLVQLALDRVELPMPFDQIQCADLTGWSGETDHPGWLKALASIDELTGRSATPSAVAPVSSVAAPAQRAVLAAEIEGMGLLLLNHRAALEEALRLSAAGFRANVQAHGGRVFREGDGAMMAVFPAPLAAVEAAVQAQGALSAQVWPGLGALKVRMAVHFGEVEPRAEDYIGPALNRIGRLLALAQGGQVLATAAIAEPLSGMRAFGFKAAGAHALEDPLTKVNLFQVEAQGLKTDFAPITVDAPPLAGNLPRRQGELIGRDADMAQIGALFESADLVTVTGTGGVGKTRIAIEYAHERQSAHADGAWLVELAPLTDPDQVCAAIARAIGFDLPAAGDPVAALVARLRPRDCLIVLDNCEHVIDAVAAVAEAVLEQTAKVKLLASSQELIGVDGERVFRLRSLGEAQAAALFVERAKAADAGFSVRSRDSEAIASICQRLDGIPLAIEMAAARAPALGCEGVLQRLDDRFRILTGGRRTALPRQRTLAATLDWSHGLLSPEDAAVFRRLGVFIGGFTLEAASRVAADDRLDAVEVIDALASLVAKSLVVAETEDNRTRYRLLETTRMYALERLAEAQETTAVQRRHAECFVAFADPVPVDYYDLSDEAFFARYAADMENIERAMEWSFGPEGNVDLGLSLVAQSWAAWAAFSRTTRYIPWSDLALSRITEETPPDLALLVRRSAASSSGNWRPPFGIRMAEQILPELRARNRGTEVGDTLYSYVNALNLTGRRDEATAVHAELMTIVSPMPTNRLKLAAVFVKGFMAAIDDRIEEARAIWVTGAEMARAAGADGWATLMQGEILWADDGDPEICIAQARDVLARVRPVHMFSAGSTQTMTYCLAWWLSARNAPGDLDEAYALVRGNERFAGRLVPGRFQGVAVRLALADGRPTDAARLFGYSQVQTAASGVNFVFTQRGSAKQSAMLREHLTASEIETLMEEGRRLTSEQFYVLAMKLDA